MKIPFFQVDAFAERRFTGNPAAVMVFERYPDDATLQALAAENNLAETAFLVRDSEDYRLRWFTPSVEVSLCGHATLASAAVVMERLEPARTRVVFHSASGPLTVDRRGASYVMDFPARPARPVTDTAGLAAVFGAVAPVAVLDSDINLMVVLADEGTLRAFEPDLAALARLARDGLIATAPGSGNHDFVSRYFAPALGIAEDPVTGSAHCTLAPYWAMRLGKHGLTAFQASARGGEVVCRLHGERVEIEGRCVFFLEGQAEI